MDKPGVAYQGPPDDDPPAGDERSARAARADRTTVDHYVAAAADVQPRAGGVPDLNAAERTAIHIADDHRGRR